VKVPHLFIWAYPGRVKMVPLAKKMSWIRWEGSTLFVLWSSRQLNGMTRRHCIMEKCVESGYGWGHWSWNGLEWNRCWCRASNVGGIDIWGKKIMVVAGRSASVWSQHILNETRSSPPVLLLKTIPLEALNVALRRLVHVERGGSVRHVDWTGAWTTPKQHTHTLKTLTHFHPLYVRGASSSGFSRY